MLSHAGLGHMIPGGFGVTIFFFLSGYLITTLMVKEWNEKAQIDFKAFYMRRSVRILPPMLIAIAIAIALSTIGLGKDLNHSGLVWDILFLSNYATLFGYGSQIPIPLWSLAIEEHFYLLFPLLFFYIIKQRKPSNVALICSIICVIVLLIRILHVHVSGPLEDIYYWSHTRIDSILFGCILATWNNPATVDRARIGSGIGWALVGGALIIITLLVRDPAFRETWRYTIQGVGLLLAFNFALRTSGIVSRVLSNKYLKLVADLSYFLYLIHVPMYLAASYLPLPMIVQYMIGISCAFFLAVIVRQFVEQPLLRWRKLFEARRDNALVNKTESAA